MIRNFQPAPILFRSSYASKFSSLTIMAALLMVRFTPGRSEEPIPEIPQEALEQSLEGILKLLWITTPVDRRSVASLKRELLNMADNILSNENEFFNDKT